MDQEPIQPAPVQSSDSQDDVDKAKGTAWLSYIGILWLIPMLTMKENSFAKFHVKQGIVLSIYAVGVSIIGSIIPFVGWFVLLPVGSILVLVFAIMGIINAAGGKWWKCPLGVSALAEKFRF
ncbi:MAG: hypothetical protein R6X13_08770 [bacterium]